MKRKNKNLLILIISLLIFSSLTIFLFYYEDGTSKNVNCSYLNPFYIDIFAFIFSLFLLTEGAYVFLGSKNINWTALIRSLIGAAIFIIHFLQVINFKL